MAIKSFGKTVKYCLFPSLCCGVVFSASAVDIFELDHDIEARKKAEKQRIKQAYKTASADARKKLADVDKQVDAAKELFDAGKQDKAIEKLQAALAFLNTMEGTMVEHKKKRVQQTMTNLRHKWAASLLEKARRECLVKRYDRAISLASEASQVDSTKTEEVGKFVEYCQKKIKSDTYTEDTSIGRVDKQYYLRERDIHILLQEAKVLYKDKRYAEVRNKLEKVFIKDNFNQEALNLLNKTYNKLYKAGQARAKADQEEQISFNDWSWIEPALPTEMGRSMSRSAEDRKSIGTDLYLKMQNIIFPKVEFEDVNINSVIRQLNRMSKRYDPDKQGISIVSQLTASVANMTPPITMSFDNMPMSEVIRYLCQGSGLKYRIQDNAVMIGLSSAIDDMKVHLFKVRATMIARIPGVDAGGAAEGGGGGGDGGASMTQVDFTQEREEDTVDMSTALTSGLTEELPKTKSSAISSQALKTYFIERGIDFPPNSAIAYNRKAGKLYVKNTRENLRKMEDLLRQIDVQTPMVMVEVKFIELTDDDVKELGFDWYFSAYQGTDPANANWTISGGGTSVNGQQATTLLRHYAPDNNNSQDANNRNYKVVNDWQIFPNFGDKLFGDNTVNLSLTVNALDQNDKVEAIAAPRVIATSGTESAIKMATRTYYPESWEDPEVTVNGNTVDVKTPVPEFGEAVDIGIQMTVTPEVSPNNYTISLHLQPQVISFSGWDYYPYTIKVGSIQTVDENNSTSDDKLVSAVKMPRLSYRDMDVRIKLYDGETVLIGGMVRTTNSNSEDRWPALGSVPLIGRFFSREFSKTLRTNLLIFVTCRLYNSDGVPVRNKNRSVAEFNR